MSELNEMSCEEFADVAAELALGVLTGRERAQAITHLDQCDTCREHVRQLSLTGEEMLGLLPSREPPAGFETRVMGRLGHPAVARRPKRTQRPQRPRPARQHPPHPARAAPAGSRRHRARAARRT